jgi:hypothetical protein
MLCHNTRRATRSLVAVALVATATALATLEATLVERLGGGSLLKLEAGQVAHVHGLKHIHGILVNLNQVNIDGRDVWDEVHAPLALLLLQLQGDAANGTPLDALHQVSREASNLVAKPLGLNYSDLLAHPLVGVKVKSEAAIILLDDDTRSLLDCFRANTTHFELAGSGSDCS